jgi:hypothetical protein
VVTSYTDVRVALGAAVATFLPNLNVYYYVPKTLVPPAAIVQPRTRDTTINYMQVHGGGGLAKWSFNVMFVIGQPDEEAAQEEAGRLISPGSPLIRAVQNIKLPSGGFAQVTTGGIAEMAFNQGLYTSAQLSVDITA